MRYLQFATSDTTPNLTVLPSGAGERRDVESSNAAPLLAENTIDHPGGTEVVEFRPIFLELKIVKNDINNI